MKSIIECKIESFSVIATIRLSVNETNVSYTIKVIDALLNHLTMAEIIESYSIREITKGGR